MKTGRVAAEKTIIIFSEPNRKFYKSDIRYAKIRWSFLKQQVMMMATVHCHFGYKRRVYHGVTAGGSDGETNLWDL